MRFYFCDLQDLPSSNGMKYSVKKKKKKQLRIALEKKQEQKKNYWQPGYLLLRIPKYSREMDKAVLFRK